MELREAIFQRQSIRAFKDREIPEEKLIKILQDANQAPSAGNLQARDFIIVREEKTKAQLAQAALGQSFLAQAPVVIAVCANPLRSAQKYGARGANLYSLIDAALAIENLMLSCIEEGIGSCYIGAFHEKRVCELLKLPKNILPIALIPIGYPAESPQRTERMPLDQIVHRERW